MGGRYDTEHMEEPRSWRPGGILWVYKGAQHAQAYIDRLSRCQRSKCRARYSEKRREPGLRRTGRAKHIIHQQRHQHSSYCKKKERSLSSVEVTMHYCMKVGNPSKRSPERSEWLKTREKKHLDQLAARWALVRYEDVNLNQDQPWHFTNRFVLLHKNVNAPACNSVKDLSSSHGPS